EEEGALLLRRPPCPECPFPGRRVFRERPRPDDHRVPRGRVPVPRRAPAVSAGEERRARVYDYFTWSEPLAPPLLPAAVSGLLPCVGARGYRFENWFRTGQRKHKAFRPAIPFTPGA